MCARPARVHSQVDAIRPFLGSEARTCGFNIQRALGDWLGGRDSSAIALRGYGGSLGVVGEIRRSLARHGFASGGGLAGRQGRFSNLGDGERRVAESKTPRLRDDCARRAPGIPKRRPSPRRRRVGRPLIEGDKGDSLAPLSLQLETTRKVDGPPVTNSAA